MVVVGRLLRSLLVMMWVLRNRLWVLHVRLGRHGSVRMCLAYTLHHVAWVNWLLVVVGLLDRMSRLTCVNS
jgi:hypothetical protein